MRPNKEKTSGLFLYVTALLRGVAIGLAVCLALLLAMALLFTLWNASLSVAAYAAVLALGVGASVGGAVTVRRIGEKGIVWGSLCGALLFAVLVLTGCLLSEQASGTSPWFRLIVSVLCGAIGGVLGLNARR